MTPIILHNPRCSTSRNALAIMKASGVEPEVVEYLKAPLTTAYLSELLTRMQVLPREVIRSKEAIYTELGLASDTVTEQQLIDAMVAHPILLNRPIVVSDKGAALCRPLERVFGLLDDPVRRFVKENGQEIVYVPE